MLSSVQDEVFEALLKTAVIENSLNEIENYPWEEIKNIRIPRDCDERIKKNLTKYSRRHQMKTAFIYIKKIAACIAIIMGVMFGILLQNNDVRAACYDVIVSIYDRFIEFRFSVSTDNNDVILGIPEYLPAGYEETADDSRSGYIYKRYSDGQNQIVIRANNQQPFLLQIDNENYEITDIDVNGYDGKLFISTDGEANRLFFSSGSGSVEIVGYLTGDQLIKIGANLK